MDVRYNLHYVGRRFIHMSDIISFAGAFIVIQIFKIIMFKKDKDYSGKSVWARCRSNFPF